MGSILSGAWRRPHKDQGRQVPMAASVTDGEAKVSERLAQFVVDAQAEHLPAKVRHEAKRSLLNFFGTAIGGCRDAAVEHAASVLSAFSGAPTATVIGRPRRTDAPS